MDDGPADPAPRPDAPVSWRDLFTSLLAGRERPRPAWLASGAIAAVAVAGALLLLRTPAPPPVEDRLPFAPAVGGAAAASGGTAATTTSVPAEIVVHAAGAVNAPGLHRVPAGSRVADVLAAAGGATPDADLDRVNLAAPVADGDRVWFPRLGEPDPPVVSGTNGTGASPAQAALVDLNRATAEELDALPGVGPTIAAAIVDHRERNGPFRSVDGLLDVRGIGPSKLEDLRPYVTV